MNKNLMFFLSVRVYITTVCAQKFPLNIFKIPSPELKYTTGTGSVNVKKPNASIYKHNCGLKFAKL